MRAIHAVLLLVLLFFNSSHAAMYVPEHFPDTSRPRVADPDDLVRRYLTAVDRGELKAFGHKLGRSMITPVRVEYIFDLINRTSRVKIYSDLKEPLAVPGRQDFRVLGVSAILDDGKIVETQSHVWIDQ